jgi:hypothetical protein
MREDIIRMAREAGFNHPSSEKDTDYYKLKRFAALVRADEREAIRTELTRLVIVPTLTHGNLVKLSDVDAAIRAREQA